MDFDIAVIGGGPGGYVAAIRAAQLGAKVAVIEKDELGGTCLNRGCIPTKSLLASAEKLDDVKKAAEFGIEVEEPKINMRKVQERKNDVVKKLVGGINQLFKKNKVEYIKGTAKVSSPNEIVCSGEETKTITCSNIIIAAGSKPALIKSLGYNGKTVITSEEALQLEKIPESLLVIGAGVIGCEFASFYNSMGTKVTMIEAMPNVLPMLDKEFSRRMQTLLKKKIDLKTKTMIKNISETGEGIEAELDSGEKIKAEKGLISIGRSLNTSGLGLEEAGIKIEENGTILVNDSMQTNVEGIYAVGDITGKMQLAHVASMQGIIAAENIMGKEKKMNYNAVPSCIFTSPEIGSVGITTEEAKEKGVPVKTGKFNFMANGKALSMGEGEGVVKIISHRENDTVLGVHIMGPHASDLIAEAALAVNKSLTVEDVINTIHAHPTLAESVMEAAEAVHGMCIHG
ncbi:MAG: dihydrolipoyl dehydrogenase [Clostridiales bacterium]|nr:dihydrolipoyl dehydrogenase [Clostridiales bacterium]MCF8021097.1 dihydrolipoyl dehydrogenase [Clostridiales bacterium]